MASLTVGGWFVSAFLDVLVDKASSYAIQQFGLYSDLKDDLKRLRTALLKTHAVLISVESRQINNDILATLLRELKDAAYDADDLLDEFEYQYLKQKVEGQNRAGNLLSSINSYLFDLDDDSTTRIRVITERLDSISADVGEILNLVDPVGVKQLEVTNKRETSSFLTESVVFGRDKEREDILKLLLRLCDGLQSDDQNVSVLPIVGMGGLGKTTLAQLVYNDKMVEDYFQLKMWVYVSAHFDMKRLLREIIESLAVGSPSDMTNLNKLKVILKENLMGKRFLLVLDDMWNDESSNWERLFNPLKFGAPGSMILITTRSQKVAAIVGTMAPIFLEGLAEDSYWSFFKKCAFGVGYSNEHPVLEAMGRKIVKKLKGSPLAAKTIGGLLNSNFNDKHWRGIMESDIWDLDQNESDIMPVLRLSYHHLPTHLKQCFAYCSIFPKGQDFEKDSLIQIWMAHGFIKPQRNKRPEDIGSEYFHNLLCWSFFQRSSETDDDYVMHDLIHDLAQSISADDCFRIEDDSSCEIPSTVRHLSFCAYNMRISVVKDSCKFKNLRTLAFLRGYVSEFNPVLHELFKELKCLRVILLKDDELLNELPDTISNSKHLRYLLIFGSRIERLPESLCSLYNLQTLKIQGCTSPILPEGMSKLINLRQLQVDNRRFPKHENGFPMFTGVGKLTSLQNLDTFTLCKESGSKIGELKDMNELRGSLHINNLENVENKEEASEAKLNNKKNLDRLMLEWTNASNGEIDTEVLEGLQPHPNLKELIIRCYRGLKSSSWLEKLKLCNLEVVKLDICPRWEVLPPLGQLPFLKVLKITSMDGVKQLAEHFHSGGTSTSKVVFPSLERLHFDSMLNWEDWSWTEVEEHELFPQLKMLEIRKCPKLRELPPFPPTQRDLFISYCSCLTSIPGKALCHLTALRKLFISNCEDMTLLGGLHGLVSLRELKIVNCPKLEVSWDEVEEGDGLSLLNFLTTDNSSLLTGRFLQKHLPSLVYVTIENCDWLTHFTIEQEQWLQNLTSLDSLRILDCVNLQTLPAELQALSSPLSSLNVGGCPKIQSLPEKGLPMSLQHLNIWDCPVLEERCRKEEGPDWIKISHIPMLDNRCKTPEEMRKKIRSHAQVIRAALSFRVAGKSSF